MGTPVEPTGRAVEAGQLAPTRSSAVYVVADTHLGLKERWLGERWPVWTEFALPLAVFLFFLIVWGARSLEIVLVFLVLMLIATPRFLFHVKQTLLDAWPGPIRGLSSDAPDALTSFLEWLAALPRKSIQERTIRIYEDGMPGTRTLRPPDHLLFLGDIIELYDAENQDILASTLPIERQLESIKSNKIYVTGNHDSQVEHLKGFRAPLGATGIRVVGEIYPPQTETAPGTQPPIRTLDVGSRSFLFIHGHQLDNVLRYRLSKSPFMAFMRQFAASVGDWSLLFVLVTIWALYVVLTTPTQTAFLVLLGSVVLWLPRVFILLARQFWRIAGLKYRPQKARQRFNEWWQSFTNLHAVPDRSSLVLVYGHTHALGHFPRQSKEDVELYNISAWLRETGKFGRYVMATFLYADEDGAPLVLGWDWADDRPFHIPLELIHRVDFGKDWAFVGGATKRKGRDTSVADLRLSEDWILKLRDELQWPPQILEKGSVPLSAQPAVYKAVLKVAWAIIRRFGKQFGRFGLVSLVAGGAYYLAPDAVVWGIEVRTLADNAFWITLLGVVTLGVFALLHIVDFVDWIKENISS